MDKNIIKVENKIKYNIQILIENNKINEANLLLDEYFKIVENDTEAYSIKAVIYIMKSDIEMAEMVLKRGLTYDDNNFDLNYNLAFLYENQKKYKDAIIFYYKSLDNCNDEELKKDIANKINKIKSKDINIKKKLVFFIKSGMDSFINRVIEKLSRDYDTKKIIVTDYSQIDYGMEWADICWFEWCDELVIYGSKNKFADTKLMICRLHSYEAFTEYPAQVIWKKIDAVIFIANNIRNYVLDRFNLDSRKTFIIPNIIEFDKYIYKNRKPGFKIAYVGYINYKKGPMLLLHTFKAIYNKDSRYKLYIAGEFQDGRDVLYFKQMIQELGIENNVFYEGWQNNLDNWLEDKNYILCTSVLESQNISVMQAMAKGIKPVIHNFVGAKYIYENKYIWNTIEEAVNIIQSNYYNSKEFSNFVKDYCNEKEIFLKIKSIVEINKKTEIDNKMPLVTIGIINYNGKDYLKHCIESFINQSYSNLEILLIDDCSKDGSEKIISEYEKKYKNIKAIYHEKNSGGASKGIQDIIQNANGKYFQWLASDDFVERNSVRNFVDYLESNSELDYVYSNFNIINDENVKVSEWNYNNYNYNDIVKKIFSTSSGVIPMNGMYKTDFFKKNKISWLIYKENDFSSDTLNCLQFIKYKWNFDKVSNNLINYRVHTNNLSHNIEKRIKSSVSLYDYIINNFPEEIYFSEIDWENIEYREQYKHYVLAEFYYKQIKDYCSLKNIPEYLKVNMSNEKLKKYCLPLIIQGKSHIEEGLKLGEVYKKSLMNLNEKYLSNNFI